MRQILVVGAGAAGMMAAITASRNGCKVIILEHTSKIGRKIEITGNGKCNFTNSNQRLDYYHTDNKQATAAVLEGFSYLDTLQFFNELGICAKNKNGYFYPAGGQASSVSDVLRMEAEQRKVKFACNVQILSIQRKEGLFFINTKGYTYEADAVILATGSMAAPSTGSDGSGYRLAKSLGHMVIKPLPALVQLCCKDKEIQALAGLRVEASVKLLIEGKKITEEFGEIQMIKTGLSGIPVLQVSRHAARALDEKKKVRLELDFIPDFSEEMLDKYLMKRKESGIYKTVRQFFIGLFHQKLTKAILIRCKIDGNKLVKDVTKEEWNGIEVKIKNFRFIITGTHSYEEAQACSGGVSFSGVEIPSLQSKLVEQLYFAGEILDVDGACGGYNLQWAWASGYAAGSHASKG